MCTILSHELLLSLLSIETGCFKLLLLQPQNRWALLPPVSLSESAESVMLSVSLGLLKVSTCT
jgi:hypothetical protein